MRDMRWIAAGLAVFILFFTVPFWFSAGRNVPPPNPPIDPAAVLAGQKCVESAEFMRANHMKMLSEWKSAVVRDGNRNFTAADGRKVEMSLENSCMNCHSNKQEFCNSCHDYAAIQQPNCWTCHSEPDSVKGVK